MIKNKIGIGAIFAAILLVNITFVPMVSAQAETLSDSADTKQVTLTLDQKSGILIIPTESKTITNLSTTKTIQKSATSTLSGTIDKNNFVVLEGVITLDGEEDKVRLSGEATQVFIGWDVPEGAKPIIYKVGNGTINHYEGITETYTTYGNLQNNISKVDNVTITRYEGATRMYATYVDLQDKEGKYKLHGEFYKDGTGGIVGKVMKNGVECDLCLLGSSKSLYENVNPTVSLASSYNVLDVPQRSQWEIWWYQGDFTSASHACGEASAAMLQEYYTGQHPDIWNIWIACGSHAATSNDLMSYFNSIGMGYIGLAKAWGTTPDYVNACIGYVEAVIDMQHPMILAENSQWDNGHWVILRGYTSPYFILRAYPKSVVTYCNFPLAI